MQCSVVCSLYVTCMIRVWITDYEMWAFLRDGNGNLIQKFDGNENKWRWEREWELLQTGVGGTGNKKHSSRPLSMTDARSRALTLVEHIILTTARAEH